MVAVSRASQCMWRISCEIELWNKRCATFSQNCSSKAKCPSVTVARPLFLASPFPVVVWHSTPRTGLRSSKQDLKVRVPKIGEIVRIVAHSIQAMRCRSSSWKPDMIAKQTVGAGSAISTHSPLWTLQAQRAEVIDSRFDNSAFDVESYCKCGLEE